MPPTSAQTVVPWTPDWLSAFAAVETAVHEALRSTPHTVEHVGSTAVPGLAAKPVIDVLAIVAQQDVPAALAALDSHGWRHDGDGGIAGRERFTARPDLPYHHLYLVPHDGREHLRMIRFRDLLRANPDAAAEYGQLKQQLAPLLLVDRDAYTAGKTEFIRRLLGE